MAATVSQGYLGEPVSTEHAVMPPFNKPLEGKYVTLESLNPSHIPLLLDGLSLPQDIDLYRLMGFPDIESAEDLHMLMFEGIIKAEGAVVLAIKANKSSLGPPSLPPTEKNDVLGFLALAYFDLGSRAVEAGAAHGPLLARTAAATEAHYLLLRHLLEAEVPFRRVSWKTNSLNIKSANCAKRLGYKHEGTFRKHKITEAGTSRDTAWYAIIDDDWPAAKMSLETWLREDNFDAAGKQKRSVQEIRGSGEQS